MTSKIEVPRELLSHAVLLLHSVHSDVAHQLTALLAAPEAPRQEPVAEVRHGPFDDVGAPQWVRVVTLGDFDLENLPDGMKLYAAPLSPYHSGGGAGMVLPERKSVFDLEGEPGLYRNGAVDGWNACLDKVKELNP